MGSSGFRGLLPPSATLDLCPPPSQIPCYRGHSPHSGGYVEREDWFSPPSPFPSPTHHKNLPCVLYLYFLFVQLVTRCLRNKGEWGKKTKRHSGFAFNLFPVQFQPSCLLLVISFLLSSCVAFITQVQSQCLNGNDIGTGRWEAAMELSWAG